jgi:hypothetical protein
MYFGFPESDWTSDFVKKRKRNKAAIALRFDSYIPFPSLDKTLLSGVYRNDLYGDIVIKEKNKNLLMLYKKAEIPLEPISGQLFSIDTHLLTDRYGDDDKCLISFKLSGDGAVTELVPSLLDHGGDAHFKKVD